MVQQESWVLTTDDLDRFCERVCKGPGSAVLQPSKPIRHVICTPIQALGRV